MTTKPANGDKVRCVDNHMLRIPTEIGAVGTCCGDVWMQPDKVWVTFDGSDETQQVLWGTEIEEAI